MGYTDEQRASAIALLEAEGYPEQNGALTKVSEQMDIPRTTIRRWFYAQSNPPPSEIVQKKRTELSDLLKEEIYGILGIMPDRRDTADYKGLGTVLGILVDKLQLLTDKPTEIIRDDSAGAKERIRDKIVRLRSGDSQSA